MKIRDIINYLEALVPLSAQEAYDNCGLLVGDINRDVSGVLLCLDCTVEVVEEARRIGANFIIAHHPVIFKGLKSLTGKTDVERTVESCVKNDIALYAIHTNLDNYRFGVNKEICDRLGLMDTSILSPKSDVLHKLSVFVPQESHAALSEALFEAGAGEIGNYKHCQFYNEGTGTFIPVGDAKPYLGKKEELSAEREIKAEFLVSTHRLGKVLSAMKSAHPYEEVAYDLYALKNTNQDEGSGMIAYTSGPLSERDFLNQLKKVFRTPLVRHTRLTGKAISKVAVCGGSGSFLIKQAISSGADVFITSDLKYHDFFEVEGQMLMIDIGHYESEQFTPNLLEALLKKKFTTFAIRTTEINTNPINYF